MNKKVIKWFGRQQFDGIFGYEFTLIDFVRVAWFGSSYFFSLRGEGLDMEWFNSISKLMIRKKMRSYEIENEV